MNNKNIKFGDLPSNARKYILMHTLGSPWMVGNYVVILYLIKTGYNILDIGILFTVANIFVAIGPMLVGKLLDTSLKAKTTMMLIYLLEAVSYFILFFATGIYASPVLLIGLIVMKFSTILYPVYPTYEHYVFPENIREQAFYYHIIIPEYVQIIAFPIFGFILSYIYPFADAYRYIFLIISFGSLLMVLYVIRQINDIKEAKFEVESRETTFKIPKGFTSLFSIETCLMIAQSLIPTLVLAYFVLVVLKQTFFILMILEVVNSSVTILLGNYLKNKELNSRSWLVAGVSLFVIGNGMFIFANYAANIIPVVFAIILFTSGNVLWFPIHKSRLFETIPEKKRGAFFGSMATTHRVIGIFIPFISAFLISVYTPLPFIIGIILYILSIIGYLIITE